MSAATIRSTLARIRGQARGDLLGADPTRSAPLDGLRGIAVLIVIASHGSNAGLHLLPWSMGGTGKSGVYLFFVLSAFLLTRLMLERVGQGTAPATRLWADYAFRRVTRIWPLYLVVLVLSLVLTQLGWNGWHYSPMDLASFRDHLLLRRGDSVLWSIPVEFKFYLVLPLLVFAMRGARDLALVWQMLAGVALLAGATWLWPPAATLDNDTRLGPYLVLFLCGAMAARIDLALATRGMKHAALGWGAIAVACALVATHPGAWAWLSGEPVDPELNHRWLLFFGLAWSALLLAALRGPAWLPTIFSAWPLRLLGAVSFSAYLWHMPVLDALRGADEGWPWLAAWGGLALVVLVSVGSWYLVERPWQRLRLYGRGRPDKMAASG